MLYVKKHEVHSQDANNSLGEVKCFISIEQGCQGGKGAFSSGPQGL